MDSKLMDRRDHSSAIAKVALFLVFAIGIGIIFAGASGLRTYEGSGFSSESAFQAIYALSAAVESDRTLNPSRLNKGLLWKNRFITFCGMHGKGKKRIPGRNWIPFWSSRERIEGKN